MKKVLIALLVVVVVIAAGLAGMYLLIKGMAGGRAISVGKDSYVLLELSGAVTEERPTDVLGGALHSGTLTMNDMLVGLREASEDSRIKALVVKIGPTAVGWGKAEGIRRAMRRFGETGKPVLAFLEMASDREYYMATGASTICALPSAILLVDGLSAQAVFMKGTLDKLGIEPEMVQVGRYKGAAEALTRESMSDPLRESLEAILDDRYTDLVDGIASSRSRPADEIMALLDEGPYTARRALAAGLVDTLMYYDDVEHAISQRVDVEDIKKITLKDYVKAGAGVGSGGESRIALVYAVGQIVLGKSRTSPLGGRTLGSETLVKALRQVRENDHIKAVVLRVDSPGGSGLASDAIWREIRRCVKEKPVVVSMSDVAASGGYFIAAGATAIVAEPGTITGSIGVVGGKFNMSGLYDKLGMNKEELARGKHALMFSENRGFTQDERTKFESMMREFYYEEFLPKVADGRGMSIEAVDSVGQGRVWTGRQALERHLVDELGGLRKAVDLAKEKAGIPAEEKVRLIQYPKEKKLLEAILEKLDVAAVLPPVVAARHEWPWEPGELLSVLPYDIEVE